MVFLINMSVWSVGRGGLNLNPSGLLPRPKVTKSKVNLTYLVTVNQAQPFFMGSVFPAPHPHAHLPHIEHPTPKAAAAATAAAYDAQVAPSR